MTLDADLAREIIDGMQTQAEQKYINDALTLFMILEGVKFPKKTKLKSRGHVIEVHTPGVPIYELRLKERL